MLHKKIAIQTEGSLPDASLTLYLWDYSEEIPIRKRPLILILPGGGYHFLSDRESEPIALRFMAMGFHTAILRYSVAPARFPVSLKETALAVSYLYEHADEYQIDSDSIFVMGFSAGGHLAASYGAYWNSAFLSQESGCRTETLRPAGLLLCYPVISSDPAIRHEGSIRELLGDDWQDEELLRKVSIDKQVHPQMPPAFLWNTMQDDTVPPENSLVLVQAYMKQGIPIEYHLYEKGGHGLSLPSALTDNMQHQCIEESCQNWIYLAEKWLNRSECKVLT